MTNPPEFQVSGGGAIALQQPVVVARKTPRQLFWDSAIIPVVCIPVRGAKQGPAQAEQASAAWAEARRAHPGVEALIGVLQRANGLQRCRDRTLLGYRRYVGLAILGHNLHALGKLLLRQQAPRSPAACSKRQERAAAA